MASGLVLNNSARSIDLAFLHNSSGSSAVEVRDDHGFKIGDASGNGATITGASGALTLTGNLAVTGSLTVGGAAVQTAGDNPAKAAVRAATTGNITLSGAQTIDGVSVIAGDRVLVKDQSTGSENGIYVAASGAWSRATDADVSAEVFPGINTFVSEGTTNGNKVFHLTTDGPITLGTTSLTFSNLVAASSFSGDLDSTSLGYLTDGTGDLRLRLRENAGASFFRVLDSDDVSLLSVDSDGAVAISVGGLSVTNGSVTIGSGNLTVSTGDLEITNGNITDVTNITATGNILTSGNITSSAGNLVITSGNADVGGNITLTSAASDLSFTSGGAIRTTNNGNLDLDPDGTGVIRVINGGLITTTNNGDLRFDTDGTGRVLIGTTYEVQDSRNPWKWSCRAATTANITLSGTQTIDGVSVVAGNRVLVKNQSTASENGIYVCAAGAWTRGADADNTSKLVAGTTVFVSEGTTNADTNWQLATNDPIVVGSTSQTWVNPVASSSFSGDMASTSQGFLSDSNGTDPVEVRDDHGFKVANGANTQSFTLTASAANEALLQGSLVVRHDAGLTIQNTAATNSVAITATSASGLTTTATSLTFPSTGITFNTAANGNIQLDPGGTGEVTIVDSLLRIGENSSGDIYLYAQNADSNKPFCRYNDTLKVWEISNDGVNAYAIYNNTQDYKASVKAATTANLSATRSGNVLTATANGAIPTIDGVTVALNDRVLVKNQTTGADNGLYFVSDAGSGGTPYTLTRTTDADSSAEVTTGLAVHVDQGTTNADTDWKLTTADPITLNTTSLTFTGFTPGSSFTGDLNATSLGKLTDSSGTLLIEGNASSNVDVKLGDAAGARSFRVIDSGNTAQLTLNSDGQMVVTGAGTGTTLQVATGDLDVAGETFTTDLTVANLAFDTRIPFVNAAGQFTSDPDLAFATATNLLKIRNIGGTASDANEVAYRGNKGFEFRDFQGVLGSKIRVLSVQTTDATFTTLQVDGNDITVPDGEVHTFVAWITGRVTVGTHAGQGVFYRLEVAVRGDASGTPVIIGTDLKTIIAEDTNVGAYDVQVITSTGDLVEFQVKGEASHTVEWRARLDETFIQ